MYEHLQWVIFISIIASIADVRVMCAIQLPFYIIILIWAIILLFVTDLQKSFKTAVLCVNMSMHASTVQCVNL